MKNIRLLPFALVGLYFLTMHFYPELAIEIKLIFAAVILLISTMILINQIKSGNISK